MTGMLLVGSPETGRRRRKRHEPLPQIQRQPRSCLDQDVQDAHQNSVHRYYFRSPPPAEPVSNSDIYCRTLGDAIKQRDSMTSVNSPQLQWPQRYTNKTSSVSDWTDNKMYRPMVSSHSPEHLFNSRQPEIEITLTSPTTKPILARHPRHDCSMENVRTFVDGLELPISPCHYYNRGRRSCGGRVVDISNDDDSLSCDRKCVRFSSLVRVCDQSMTVAVCPLREQSATGKRPSCERLPPLHVPRQAVSSRVDCSSLSPRASSSSNVNLPAVVERYMKRSSRQKEYRNPSV